MLLRVIEGFIMSCLLISIRLTTGWNTGASRTEKFLNLLDNLDWEIGISRVLLMDLLHQLADVETWLAFTSSQC
jgi:hypothetical protein